MEDQGSFEGAWTGKLDLIIDSTSTRAFLEASVCGENLNILAAQVGKNRKRQNWKLEESTSLYINGNSTVRV